jgi:zinc protease
MSPRKALLMVVAASLLAGAVCTAQATRPSELRYPALTYNPPDPAALKVTYGKVLRAYVKEDNALPLVSISALVNFGDLYVPKGKEGLGALLGDTLIKGGTKTREGDAIEARIDFIGGTLSFRVADRISTLSLSVLSKDLDEGLELFFDVLRNPEFREAPVNLARARLIERLRQVNDQPSTVLAREFEKVVYGDHPITAQPTKKSYEALTQADLKAILAQYFVPKNMILTAAGDFTKADLKAKIEKQLAGWKGQDVKLPVLAKSFADAEPGVYFVQKAINQGYISLGHLGIEDTNPDYYAVQVMNFILGGGSFTSRITSKVRSDEGLSYNQGSRFTYRWGFPGTFTGYVQTKSATVGYAISLIQAEFKRVRETEVTDAEMEVAVNYFLESFPSSFETAENIVATFANLEMTGKPMDYYKTYRDKISAVTKAKVREVANKYIQPDKMAIMIVGDFEPCNKGGDKWPGPLDKLGKIHTVKLVDPMTGELIP